MSASASGNHEDIAAFDPRSPAFVKDPFPYYVRLRQEAPVCYLPSMRMWWVTRHADAMFVLSDKRFGTEPADHSTPSNRSLPPSYGKLKEIPPNMVERNPPDHTRLRSLVNKAFTPRTVERLRPHIQLTVDQLLTEGQKRGEFDLIRDFAFLLPVTIIAELLGVPIADRTRFKIWSQRIIMGMDATQPEEVHRRSLSSSMAFSEYLSSLIEARRQNPQDDLLSELIAAEQQGERLSSAELLSNAGFLLVAGHVTTTNLLGNGMLALLQHPEQWALVREHPEFVTSAVEEMLRFAGPIQRIGRNAMEDLELGGQLIRKGDRVVVVLGAANRDPAVFADAETFDATRKENPHLAFGRSIHFCLGAPLARLEAQIALSALARLSDLKLADTEPDWGSNTVIRGLKTLPVTLLTRG